MWGCMARGPILAALETVVMGAGFWLNETRRDEGPVLLPLTNGHGVHRMDLLVVAAGLLVAIIVLGWPVRRGDAGPDRRIRGPAPHPPIGPPRPGRLGHDQ